jgi:hypothetical protein
MTTKEYYISIITHNKIQVIANGYSKIEIDTKLKESLRLFFISADMFNQTNSNGGASYFLNLADEALYSAIQKNNYNLYNVSYLGEIFDRNKKISELLSDKSTADNARSWSCLWEISKNNITGILGATPTAEDLRWLVTDTGFFITKDSPSENSLQTIDEKEALICEFISQFDVAFKYGASRKVLQIFAEIIKKNISSFYQSKGDFSHLSIDDLEAMLIKRESLEKANIAMGTNFVVRGLSSFELRKIIAEKNSSNKSSNDVIKFKISNELEKYMNEIQSIN